jgi:hypothetical protein
MAKPSDPISIKIANKNYGKAAKGRLFITATLKHKLERIKKKDGTDLYTNLLARGFSGGKHLIETVHQRFGSDKAIVLSDQPCGVSKTAVTIDYERFGAAARSKFFAMYRETGLQSSNEFLRANFPSYFSGGYAKSLPRRKVVREVLTNLPEAIQILPKRDRGKLPDHIAELIAKEEPSFLYEILKATETASERTKLAIKEMVAKLSRESQAAKAMQELSDFMDDWNLLQVTSLLSVLKSRLNTIATFEEMIHNDKTYELKGESSIHRVLEKSMWLIDDKYWIVQSNRSLRDFIGKEMEKRDKRFEKRRPDFACATFGNNLILIEIKRPSIELKKTELDQIEDYLVVIKKYKGQTYRSIDAYLIGNTISEEARERAELRKTPDLLTYQDLLEQCRQRYNEYLRIIET